MTRRASAFAVVDGLSARDITDPEGRTAQVETRTDIGNKNRKFCRLKSEGRHTRARHAGGNRVADVVVRRGAPELLTGKIDARDSVAVVPVAECALRGVKPVSRLNVGRTVLTGLCVDARASCEPHAGEQRGDSRYPMRSAHG